MKTRCSIEAHYTYFIILKELQNFYYYVFNQSQSVLFLMMVLFWSWSVYTAYGNCTQSMCVCTHLCTKNFWLKIQHSVQLDLNTEKEHRFAFIDFTKQADRIDSHTLSILINFNENFQFLFFSNTKYTTFVPHIFRSFFSI